MISFLDSMVEHHCDGCWSVLQVALFDELLVDVVKLAIRASHFAGVVTLL